MFARETNACFFLHAGHVLLLHPFPTQSTCPGVLSCSRRVFSSSGTLSPVYSREERRACFFFSKRSDLGLPRASHLFRVLFDRLWCMASLNCGGSPSLSGCRFVRGELPLAALAAFASFREDFSTLTRGKAPSAGGCRARQGASGCSVCGLMAISRSRVERCQSGG